MVAIQFRVATQVFGFGRLPRGFTTSQFRVVNQQLQPSVRDIQFDLIADLPRAQASGKIGVTSTGLVV